MMEDKGFVVKRERVPVSHYRSTRRRWPKSTTSGDGKVIKFLEKIPEQIRKDAMFRAYGRHRQRHHRMQEAAEQRKRQEVPRDELDVE